MGQKVSPIGFRLGINKTWESKWFSRDGYATWLSEDLKIRNFIKLARTSLVCFSKAKESCILISCSLIN